MLSDGGFTYNEVFHQMTQDEVDEANIALDMQIECNEKGNEKEIALKRGGEKDG